MQPHPPRRPVSPALARLAAAMTLAAWSIAHSLLPARLILGGGIMDTEFERFAGPIRRQLEAATQFSRDAVAVVPAVLGNGAGLVGAACLVTHR